MSADEREKRYRKRLLVMAAAEIAARRSALLGAGPLTMTEKNRLGDEAVEIAERILKRSERA